MMLNTTSYKINKVKSRVVDIPANPGEGLKSLPDLNEGRNLPVDRRIKWHIYKVFRKKEYYYHTKPLDSKDSIYQKNIDVSTAMDRVRTLNKKSKG